MEFFNEFEKINKTRHKLPHWQQGEVPVFMTWRLDDSLPEAVVEKWKQDRARWVKGKPEPWDDETKREYQRRFVMKLEEVLDDCHGSCVLEQPAIRKIVIDSLHFYDDERLSLDCYVIMPNHVHALFTVKFGHQLEGVMKSIKGFSSREINKLLGKVGSLWQADFWDRLIRSESHLLWTRNYIRKNPEKLREGRFALWTK